MMENKNNKKDIIKNIIGGFFIFIGFFGMFSSGIISGVLMMLFGTSLLPIFYKKNNLNKYKQIKIILPIVVIILFAISLPKTTSQTNSNINTTEENYEKEETIQVSSLNLNESNIEIDIKEIKNLVLEIMPENANKDDLEFCSTNTEIALIEECEDEEISSNNIINFIIKPVAEGDCEVYAKASNGIESNRVAIKIIDNERIQKEAEEQAKKEAEEQAKKEAEEQEQREAEQKKLEEEKAKQEESSEKAQSSTTTQPTSQPSAQNSTTDTSRTVYRTPTGKRYHYDPDCGGKNSYSVTLDAAKSAGLTPCQKCAK